MINHYSYAIDPEGNDTANKVLRFVGTQKRVLELGTAGGVMTKELSRQQCKVWGVEYNAELAKEAEPYCEEILVQDIEDFDFEKKFGAGFFDVIVAADVLEHLRSPELILRALHPLLAKDGYIVLSLPNIAFSGIVAGLLQGRFDYREKGLLDSTHLRFFTRATLENTLLTCAWMPVAWEYQRVEIDRTEFLLDWIALSNTLKESLQNRTDGDIYQFIVKAVPARQEAWNTVMTERHASISKELNESKIRSIRLEQENTLLKEKLHDVNTAFSEARKIIATLEERLENEKLNAIEQNALIEKFKPFLEKYESAMKEKESLQTELKYTQENPVLHPITATFHKLFRPSRE